MGESSPESHRLASLHAVPGFEPKPLLSRVVERSPAEVCEQLQQRAERAASYLRAIRVLADEDGDAALVAEMLAEAGADLVAVAEAGVQLLIEQEHAEAFAETRVALAKEELERARAALASVDATKARIRTRILAPCLTASGAGVLRTSMRRIYATSTAGRVEIDDDAIDFLPAPLVRIKREADKEAIRAALESGADVVGARLVRGTRIEVRP